MGTPSWHEAGGNFSSILAGLLWKELLCLPPCWLNINRSDITRGLCRSVPIPSPPKISKQLRSLEHLYPSNWFSRNGNFMEDLQADAQILGQSLLLLLFPRCLKPFGIHQITWMVNSVIGYIPIFCLKALFSEEIQAHVAVAIPSYSSSPPSLLRFFFFTEASVQSVAALPFTVFIPSRFSYFPLPWSIIIDVWGRTVSTTCTHVI